MMLNLVNLFTTSCVLFALWCSVSVYRLVRAPSVFWLVIAISYISAVRITVALAQSVETPNWVTLHTSWLLIPFYPLLALSLYLLLRSLRVAFKNYKS